MRALLLRVSGGADHDGKAVLQRKVKRAFGRGVKGKVEHDVGRLQNFGKGRKRTVSAAADHGPCGAVRKSGVQQRAKRSAHRAVCAVQKDPCHLKHPMLRARSEGRPGVLPPSG